MIPVVRLVRSLCCGLPLATSRCRRDADRLGGESMGCEQPRDVLTLAAKLGVGVGSWGGTVGCWTGGLVAVWDVVRRSPSGTEHRAGP
jgi:hypothetical protein